MIKKVINNEIKKISSVKQIINSELKDIKKVYKGNKLMFSNILPKEYQEVEYLESTTPEQYIKTGIVSSFPIKFEWEGMVLNYGDCYLFGTRDYTVESGRIILGHVSTFYIGFGNYSFVSVTGYNTKRKAILSYDDKGSVNWDIDGISGRFDSIYSKDFKHYEIGLFAALYYTSDVQTKIFGSKSRCYSFKIYKEDALLRYMIPCYRKTDNKPGMYDLISGQFFTNQGTGEFIIGSEV